MEFHTHRQDWSSWAAAVNAKALNRSSQLALVLARASHPSHAQTFVGVVMCHINVYPLLSAYCCSVHHYKRMRLLTRVYGMCGRVKKAFSESLKSGSHEPPNSRQGINLCTHTCTHTMYMTCIACTYTHTCRRRVFVSYSWPSIKDKWERRLHSAS